MAKTSDPGAMFNEMLVQWERTTNDIAGKIMGSDEFGRGMNSAAAFALKLQESIRDQTSRFLAAANLPTREDVTRIAEVVGAIDARLARIESLLAGSAAGAPHRERPRPPRTRKPKAGTE